MAKVSVENLSEESLQNTNNEPQVVFFSLKDGEEAIVRILISNYNDFDIHTVHNVKMEGYQYGRRMNCLRQPNDPLEVCPLCAAGEALDQKLYLHLIHYTVEGDKIVSKSKVWERSIKDRNFGVNALKTYLSNYGDLSEMICKIIRRGSGLQTEYQLIPNLNPAVYRPDLYIKDTSAFENWSPIGIAILNKTAAEYNTFLSTGSFPQVQSNRPAGTQVTPRTYENSANSAIPNSTVPYQTTSAPATPNTFVPGVTVPNTVTPAEPPYNPTPNYEAPAQPTYQPSVNPTPSIPNQPVGETPYGNTTPSGTMPWNNPSSTGGFERPRRY